MINPRIFEKDLPDGKAGVQQAEVKLKLAVQGRALHRGRITGEHE